MDPRKLKKKSDAVEERLNPENTELQLGCNDDTLTEYRCRLAQELQGGKLERKLIADQINDVMEEEKRQKPLRRSFLCDSVEVDPLCVATITKRDTLHVSYDAARVMAKWDAIRNGSYIPKVEIDEGLENLVKREESKDIPCGIGNSPRMENEESTPLVIPSGKLGLSYWCYAREDWMDEELVEMSRCFPAFEICEHRSLESNNLLYWHGTLCPGVYNNIEWEVKAFYDMYEHRTLVYLVKPSIEYVINMLNGLYPRQLSNDGEGCLYLDASERTIKSKVTITAAKALTWTVRWLTIFEMICVGKSNFNSLNRLMGL